MNDKSVWRQQVCKRGQERKAFGGDPNGRCHQRHISSDYGPQMQDNMKPVI